MDSPKNKYYSRAFGFGDLFLSLGFPGSYQNPKAV
jgi:hypothetical protein